MSTLTCAPPMRCSSCQIYNVPIHAIHNKDTHNFIASPMNICMKNTCLSPQFFVQWSIPGLSTSIVGVGVPLSFQIHSLWAPPPPILNPTSSKLCCKLKFYFSNPINSNFKGQFSWLRTTVCILRLYVQKCTTTLGLQGSLPDFPLDRRDQSRPNDWKPSHSEKKSPINSNWHSK